MSDAELLKRYQELLDELEVRKASAIDHVEARHYSVCFTHVEDSYLRFKPLVHTPVHSHPAMIHIEQAIGG